MRHILQSLQMECIICVSIFKLCAEDGGATILNTLPLIVV